MERPQWQYALFGTVAMAAVLGAAGLERHPVPAPPLSAVADRPVVAAGYGRIPLHFEENRGQAADAVKYLARGPGYTLLLTPTEQVLRLRASSDKEAATLRVSLLDANAAPSVAGEDAQPGRSHYLTSRASISDIPHYARVRYAEVYPGIDLVYYGNQRQLEYDFVVAPGADPGAIRLRYRGADHAEVNEQGDLVLSLAGGEVIQKKPVVYQQKDGRQVDVEGRFVVAGDTEVAFALGGYDRALPLVIDPVLLYSTYLGGSRADAATAIAVDAAGNAYLAGYTESSNFDVAGGSGSAGEQDAFITKLGADGGSLVYSTYLGGSDSDTAYAIAVDAAGSAYVAGSTASTDFITVGAIEGDSVSTDAFVAKLSADGGSLMYSTYLGGGDDDYAYAITIDAAGSAYVAGSTTSVNFNTVNAIEGYSGNSSSDAFIAKLSADGGSLLYSTYLGGSFNDRANAIAVDAAGSAYVAGSTSSEDFNTVNPIQGWGTGLINIENAFIAKLSADGGSLVYSTFLGGSNLDHAYAIAVDAAGSAYVAGDTGSTDFNTVNAIEAYNDGTYSDAFIAKLSADGGSLIYSTYLGGTDYDSALGIAIDAAGSAYVVGYTSSTDFNTGDAVEADAGDGSSDAFVAKLTADGGSLVYSTYLGGSGNDFGTAIGIDAAGNAYVAGSTESTDFDTVGALEGDSGESDVFIAKLGAPSGSLAFSDAGYTVGENAGAATITLLRSDAFSGAISVSYTASAGSAAVGGDFTAVSGTLNWGDGDTGARSFSVPIVDDGAVESDETVSLALSDPLGGATLGSPSSAVLTIVDDDVPPPPGKLQFTSANFKTAESVGSATVYVSRAGGTAGAVSVNYATADGTASAGSDYGATSGTLSWADGDAAAKPITVIIVDDRKREDQESLTLLLSSPVGGATLGQRATATLSIDDDDECRILYLLGGLICL